MRLGTNAWRLAGCGLLLAAVSGCGKAVTLAEVSGLVTVNGKPQPGLVVTFYPVVGQGQPRLPFARGTSDETGRYSLTAEDGKPGAVVGKCKAVVNWPVRSGHETKAQPDPFVMPITYTTLAETPLEFEVQQGTNDIPIELKRQ